MRAFAEILASTRRSREYAFDVFRIAATHIWSNAEFVLGHITLSDEHGMWVGSDCVKKFLPNVEKIKKMGEVRFVDKGGTFTPIVGA